MKTDIAKLLKLRADAVREAELKAFIERERKEYNEKMRVAIDELESLRNRRAGDIRHLHFGRRIKQTDIARNSGIRQGNVSRIVSNLVRPEA